MINLLLTIITVLAMEDIILYPGYTMVDCTEKCALNKFEDALQVTSVEYWRVKVDSNSLKSKTNRICKNCFEICGFINKIENVVNLNPEKVKVRNSTFTLLKDSNLGYLGVQLIRNSNRKIYLIVQNEAFPKYHLMDATLNLDNVTLESLRDFPLNTNSIIFVYSFGNPNEFKKFEISEICENQRHGDRIEKTSPVIFYYLEFLKFTAIFVFLSLLTLKLKEYLFSKIENNKEVNSVDKEAKDSGNTDEKVKDNELDSDKIKTNVLLDTDNESFLEDIDQTLSSEQSNLLSK